MAEGYSEKNSSLFRTLYISRATLPMRLNGNTIRIVWFSNFSYLIRSVRIRTQPKVNVNANHCLRPKSGQMFVNVHVCSSAAIAVAWKVAR